MALVRIMFKPMQLSELHESETFNTFHIMTSHFNHDRVRWFDRVPQVGEFVIFPSLLENQVVPFQVDEVQHFPREAESLPAATEVPTSLILLRPILAKDQQPSSWSKPR